MRILHREEVQEVKIPLKLSISKVTDRTTNKYTIFVDESKFFPLVLKKWQEGDFSTLWDERKKKKLVSFSKMRNCQSLIKKIFGYWSADTIVWVVGLRQDERFKTENNTEHILKLEIQ
jgi:tRNA(Ile)-lysidine synthase